MKKVCQIQEIILKDNWPNLLNKFVLQKKKVLALAGGSVVRESISLHTEGSRFNSQSSACTWAWVAGSLPTSGGSQCVCGGGRQPNNESL